jgi:membrane-associated PAP2 superfamily phosphatase
MGGVMTEIGLGGWRALTRPPNGRRSWIIRGVSRLELLLSSLPRLHDPIMLCLLAVLGSSALFLLFPAIDMAASEVFFRAGAGFPLSQEPLLKAFRKSADLALALLVTGLIAGLVWGIARRGPGALVSARRSVFLIAALVIGPGLVVNGLFKSWWGRPRPVAVDVFGGEAPYQTVWRISDWCQSNCSFVSGEASSAAWLVAATVLIPARLRPVLVPPVVLYALLISLNRLAFGGHFLSDIVLSWAISGLVFTVLYRVMVSAPGVATRVRVRAWKGVSRVLARTAPRLPR